MELEQVVLVQKHLVDLLKQVATMYSGSYRVCVLLSTSTVVLFSRDPPNSDARPQNSHPLLEKLYAMKSTLME